MFEKKAFYKFQEIEPLLRGKASMVCCLCALLPRESSACVVWQKTIRDAIESVCIFHKGGDFIHSYQANSLALVANAQVC